MFCISVPGSLELGGCPRCSRATSIKLRDLRFDDDGFLHATAACECGFEASVSFLMHRVRVDNGRVSYAFSKIDHAWRRSEFAFCNAECPRCHELALSGRFEPNPFEFLSDIFNGKTTPANAYGGIGLVCQACGFEDSAEVAFILPRAPDACPRCGGDDFVVYAIGRDPVDGRRLIALLCRKCRIME